MQSVNEQRELQLRKEVAHLETALAQERVDSAKSLSSIQASLRREESLRVALEEEQHALRAECAQLRIALRALLNQSPGDSSAWSTPLTVPVSVYEDARRLLLRCQDVFAEMRALQLRATDPAYLELLRQYDIPLLDNIPPPWVPGALRDSGKGNCVHEPGVVHVGSNPHTGHSALKAATAGMSQPLIEKKQTKARAPTKTMVSPIPACSTSATTWELPGVNTACGAVEMRPGKGDSLPADTSSNGLGDGNLKQQAIGANPSLQPRRIILSPPVASPDTGIIKPIPSWTGPMHQFAEMSSRPETVSQQHHTQPRGVEQEDRSCGADLLFRRMASEAATLAESEGLRTASEVAAMCHRRGLPYIDSFFLPVLETLGLDDTDRYYDCDPVRVSPLVVQWRPCNAILPSGRKAELLTSAGVDPNLLECGPLGDVGVVAAFAALSEATGAVTSVLANTTAEDEDNGLYSVWLCVNGWWICVTVDSFLPCVIEQDRSFALYGCRSTPVYDLWAPICEKALAKVMRGYRPLPSLTAEAVVGLLTGGPVEYWDWWHNQSVTALEEMEAVLNTNARGAGVVLLSTFSDAALRGALPRQMIMSEIYAAYQRLGLRPGTSYRVLAVADNGEGDSMVLIRNWTRGHQPQSATRSCSTPGQGLGDAADTYDALSPRREGSHRVVAAAGQSTRQPLQSSVTADHGDSCIWVRFTQEVLPLFDTCHVCFDCRRYHDLRVPITFSGHRLGVPAQLVRVRVQESFAESTDARSRCPTRLWIGLHKPCTRPSTGDTAPPDFCWGLKLTLVGQEEAPAPFGVEDACMHPARRSYLLSESFLGKPQVLPAVWMYLELDAVANDVPHFSEEVKDEEKSMTRTTIEFFVVPQIEHITNMGRGSAGEDVRATSSPECDALSLHHHCAIGQDMQRNLLGGTGAQHSGQTGYASGGCDALCPQHSADHITALCGRSFGMAATSTLAVLAENRNSVRVDVVEAPEELRAAMYHNVLDRIDFSNCELARGGGKLHTSGLPRSSATARSGEVLCQLNGRDMRIFTW